MVGQMILEKKSFNDKPEPQALKSHKLNPKNEPLNKSTTLNVRQINSKSKRLTLKGKCRQEKS